MNKILFTSLVLTAMSMVTTSTAGATDDLSRVSKSSGSIRNTAKTQAEPKTQLQAPLVTDGPRQRKRQPKSLSKNNQVFWIYDAYALLNFDEDGDGFHHNFSVVFDADVDHDVGFVYADLYLSLEGGPWNHYFTTDVFSIEGSTDLDEYEVATELNSGYVTGYYDVLIELVDADTDELVAAADSIDFGAIAALPLEDSDRDFVSYSSVSHGHGGGALSSILLLLMGLAGVRSIQKTTRSLVTVPNRELSRLD